MNALQRNDLDDKDIAFEVPNAFEQFKVTNLEQATWAFRKMSAIDAKKAEIKSLADAERQRIADFEQREQSLLDSNRSFFESLLAQYGMSERDKDPKFKARTPYGTVSFRKSQPKWEYDDAKLIESLKAADRSDLIRIKEEPDKATLKKEFAVDNGRVVEPTSGVFIEGVTVTAQADKLEIKVEV